MAKKILIVEDEAMLREMYSQKFTEAGLEVITAEQAEAGIEMAKTEKPDLVLLDILLPEHNGIYFLEQIRKDEATKNLKVIAFSNYDDSSAKKQAEKLGVLDYLIKTNFTPKEVVARVKKYA